MNRLSIETGSNRPTHQKAATLLTSPNPNHQTPQKRIKLSTSASNDDEDNKENEKEAETDKVEPVVVARPENESVPREEGYKRKWGTYPKEYTGGCL